MKSRRNITLILSLVTVLLCTVFCIVAARTARERDKEFGLGDYSEASIEEYEDSFANDPSSENLVELLKALCFKAEVQKEQSVISKIEKYGTILYDRARAEEIDLEKMDDEKGTILELLGYLKKYGAK